MSDIHYIKIKARNMQILTKGKMTPSKGIMQVFLVGLVHQITQRCRLLVLNYRLKKGIQSIRIHVPKNSSL